MISPFFEHDLNPNRELLVNTKECMPLNVIMAGEECWLFSSLESLVVPSDTMKDGGGGFHVSSYSGPWI